MGSTAKVPDRSLSVDEIRLVANAMRTDIIDMLEKSGSGHPGGSLSAADFMATLLFSGVMEYDHEDPDDHGADRFFLSKGHAAPVLYAAYHQLGWLSDDDLMTLRQLGSKLQGHPDSHACPGVEVCSGSLGQGLSVAAGCALGLRMDGSAARVFTLVGDGELQEGSNWEALMFAAHRGLSNLTMVLDLNNLQIDGHVTDVCSLGDVDAKLADFGWHVQHVDGHDVRALHAALQEARSRGDEPGAPQAIVMDTVKGRGVSFMEDQVGWHGSAPNAEQAAIARAELAEERERILEQIEKGE